MPRERNRPLCTDARMLGRSGSGVATYAAALRRAQLTLDPAGRLLTDPGGGGRAGRWGSALWPGTRTAVSVDEGSGQTDFTKRGLFRLAQVWFDVHRRLLPVRVPGPPGIMHWSYPVPLRLVGWANLYTVHDAIPLVAPELTPISRRRHARLLRGIAAEASHLVTVSAAARDEVTNALGLNSTQVVDCGQGVEALPAVAPLPADLRAGGYLLTVGSVEPRKNLTRLVEAWQVSGTALPLVLAGGDGWRSDSIGLDARPGLVRLGEVSPATLGALLAHARALLMPSLAEGFGLPVVEAQAVGTAVLTSNRGALAEVAGAAALLVNPLDVGAIACGIRALVEDDALAAQLVATGRVNAGRFTPERFAERLASLYAQVEEEAR